MANDAAVKSARAATDKDAVARFQREADAALEEAKAIKIKMDAIKAAAARPQPPANADLAKLDADLEKLKVELVRLAQVYATTFPLAEGAAVRRINDKEAATVAGSVAEQAD